jgi:hypothetical protein
MMFREPFKAKINEKNSTTHYAKKIPKGPEKRNAYRPFFWF